MIFKLIKLSVVVGRVVAVVVVSVPDDQAVPEDCARCSPAPRRLSRTRAARAAGTISPWTDTSSASTGVVGPGQPPRRWTAALRGGQLLWLDAARRSTAGHDRHAARCLRVPPGRSGERGPSSASGRRRENFDDMFAMVGYAATTVGGPLTEVHAYYAEKFLITVARQGCDVLDELRRQLAMEHRPPPPGRPVRLHPAARHPQTP